VIPHALIIGGVNTVSDDLVDALEIAELWTDVRLDG
jgi:hypothetical protein